MARTPKPSGNIKGRKTNLRQTKKEGPNIISGPIGEENVGLLIRSFPVSEIIDVWQINENRRF